MSKNGKIIPNLPSNRNAALHVPSMTSHNQCKREDFENNMDNGRGLWNVLVKIRDTYRCGWETTGKTGKTA